MLSAKARKIIADNLLTLWKSCDEGITGEWDGTEEGFIAMQKGIEKIAEELGIKLFQD